MKVHQFKDHLPLHNKLLHFWSPGEDEEDHDSLKAIQKRKAVENFAVFE
jgi:hypothetical protein